MVDFHIHTIYSDGTDDINSLLEKTKDLEHFAITDHDSIEGIKYIINNGLKVPNLVYGVELSTRDNNDSVHILFYNYDNYEKTIYCYWIIFVFHSIIIYQ